MSDDRFFPNPFVPYSEDACKTIIDINEKKLTDDFKNRIYNAVYKLTLDLEQQLSHDIDWHDTSIYTGCSGYAFLFYQLAEKLNKGSYTEKGASLIEKCLKLLKAKRYSFLCGDAGPLALGAVIFNKLDSQDDIEFCLSKLRIMKNAVDADSSLPDELLFGRVGYLYSLLFIQQNLGFSRIDDEFIRPVIDSILESGQKLAKQENLKIPLMYKWHDKHYLGAAHGIVGIIFVLLQVHHKLTSSEMTTFIQPMVDYICSLVFPSGNLPSSLGSTNDRLIHWCHGAPGALFLFALAYKVFEEKKYLDYAAKCADVIWRRGLLQKGYSLCHGTGGNGYALLYLFQITKDVKYLYMAAQFASWCLDFGRHGCRTSDRPLSLFEGKAGCIFFLSDLLDVENARFPGFVL